jgi:pyruvate dehydrogenase E2 component (dihydrolipoamide acetyltransferase)
MPINILMPALSPTMEKGNLAKWLKKEGDTVKSGDVIAEIETDKATMEVEAVDEGILAKIVVPEGTADVPVNQLIALIAGEGEDPKSVTAPAAGGAAPTLAPKPEAAPAPAAPEAAPQPQANTIPGDASAHMSYARVDQAPAGPAQAAKPNGAGQATGNRVFASPLAKRIAKDAGIDIASVQSARAYRREGRSRRSPGWWRKACCRPGCSGRSRTGREARGASARAEHGCRSGQGHVRGRLL